MRVYVTGGLGVIGSEFAKEMVRQGHEVKVLDACEEPRNEWMAGELEPLGVAVRRERMEAADLSEVLDYDLVLHAAAFTGIPFSAIRPDDDWASNVEATRNLLSTLRTAARPPRTVVLSSVKPYSLKGLEYAEEETRYTCRPAVDEGFPMSPDEPYAASKMAQSAICTAYARTYGLPLTVFRCSNLYGAAPCHGPRHGWLTWFCVSAALGHPITVQGNGKQSRDMLYSSDVTSAVLTAADSMHAVKGRLFNVGGGQSNVISVREAADFLKGLSGVEVRGSPGRRFEDLAFVTDCRKFELATSWRPKVSVERGMRAVYDWARAHEPELRKAYAEYL